MEGFSAGSAMKRCGSLILQLANRYLAKVTNLYSTPFLYSGLLNFIVQIFVVHPFMNIINMECIHKESMN